MPQQQVHCLVCAQPMRKVVIAGGIEIDCCDAHGVWLDVGELAALLNQQQAQAPREPAPTARRGQKKSALEGVGTTLLRGAASGAGFGAGSALASSLVRKLFR